MVNTEVVEQEVGEVNKGIGLGTVGVLAVAGIGGAILWNKALLPALGWVKRKINEARDKRRHNKQAPVEAVEPNVK
jgi:hypothetical protein